MSEQSSASESSEATVTATAAAAPVDVDAAVSAALAKQQAEFKDRLKAATGHEDFDALAKAKLQADGDYQALAEKSVAEAQSWKGKYQQTAINNALLGAATDALDANIVVQLLGSQCVCDEASGAVTIGGKPVAEAVKQLFAEKPFLAKPAGGQGSGAGATGVVKTSGEDGDKTPLDRLKAARNTGAN
jgi:hypothetical protein